MSNNNYDNNDPIINSKIEEFETLEYSENSEHSECKNGEMNFLEHLEELRRRIIYIIVFFIISCIPVAVFISDLMQKIFLAPALNNYLTLQNFKPFGQPFLL